MKFAHLYHRLHGGPLMLLPSAYEHFSHALEMHMGGGATMIQMQGGEMPKAAAPTMGQLGRLAVIPLSGAIDRNLSGMAALCSGACDINDVTAALREADADPRIDTIILSVDSPGGNVDGMFDAAELFRDIGTRKTTGAYVAGMAASGGYLMACQAGAVVCEQTSVVGSIGVISGRMDMTGAMQQKGVKATIISRGSRKSDGHPATEMGDEELAARTAIVEQMFGMFEASVKAVRPDVSAEVFESGVYIGANAVKVGLVDGLCSSLDEFAAELLTA